MDVYLPHTQMFGCAFISHALMSIFGILFLREMNPEFAEYKKIQAESKQKTKVSIKTALYFLFHQYILKHFEKNEQGPQWMPRSYLLEKNFSATKSLVRKLYRRVTLEK